MEDRPNPCKCGAKKSTTLNLEKGEQFIKCESCGKESKRFSLFEPPMTELDNPVQRAVNDWNEFNLGRQQGFPEPPHTV